MESLPVPSVQAMVAATGGADVPSRYLRPEAAVDAVAVAGEDQIPIIDYRRLLLDHGEESARLHRVCQDWGFFQIFTNGRYRSIKHRAVVDPKEERLSVAAFHSPHIHAMIGPLKEIAAHVRTRPIRRLTMRTS
ncbi:hypothetical protein ACQ4PT_017165 [Festuca glaucescens]